MKKMISWSLLIVVLLSSFPLTSVYAANDLIWPVDGHTVTSLFGYRYVPSDNLNGPHRGVDVGGKLVSVKAMGDGIVKTVDKNNSTSFGNYVVIYHKNLGVSTLYAHLNSINVSVDKTVKQGDIIGKSGNTGGKYTYAYHLHFEVLVGEVKKNTSRTNATPINPLESYHRTDVKSAITNPNPVFILSNGKYVYNQKFDPKFKFGSWHDSKTNKTYNLQKFEKKTTGQSNNQSVKPPSSPANFTATKASEKTAKLSWSAASGATSYEIQYYSRKDTAWKSDPDYKTKTSTSYVSTGLSNYDSYKYRVRAVNSAGKSGWNEITYTKTSTTTSPTPAPSTKFGTLTIKYNANGGSGAPASHSTVKSYNGAKFTLSSEKPTRTNYTFTGWLEENKSTNRVEASGQGVILAHGSPESNSTVTYYAQWQEKKDEPNNITVPPIGGKYPPAPYFSYGGGEKIEYDDSMAFMGEIKKVTYYDTSGTMVGYSVFTRSVGSFKFTRTDYWYKNGALDYYVVNDLDENGDVISATFYSPDGKPL